MKVFRLAAIFALLAGPAYAQMPNINLMPQVKTLTPEEKEQEAAQQKAYRESLKKFRTPRPRTIHGAPCATRTRPRRR